MLFCFLSQHFECSTTLVSLRESLWDFGVDFVWLTTLSFLPTRQFGYLYIVRSRQIQKAGFHWKDKSVLRIKFSSTMYSFICGSIGGHTIVSATIFGPIKHRTVRRHSQTPESTSLCASNPRFSASMWQIENDVLDKQRSEQFPAHITERTYRNKKGWWAWIPHSV